MGRNSELTGTLLIVCGWIGLMSATKYMRDYIDEQSSRINDNYNARKELLPLVKMLRRHNGVATPFRLFPFRDRGVITNGMYFYFCNLRPVSGGSTYIDYVEGELIAIIDYRLPGDIDVVRCSNCTFSIKPSTYLSDIAKLK